MISEKAGPAGGLAGTLITLRTWALKREFSVSAAEYRGSVEIQGSVCHQPLPPPQVMLVVKTCLPMQEMREAVSIPASGKSLRVGEWQSTTVFMPRKFHRQRSLVDYSPWGHKESGMTEQLSTHTDTGTHTDNTHTHCSPFCWDPG